MFARGDESPSFSACVLISKVNVVTRRCRYRCHRLVPDSYWDGVIVLLDSVPPRTLGSEFLALKLDNGFIARGDQHGRGSFEPFAIFRGFDLAAARSGCENRIRSRLEPRCSIAASRWLSVAAGQWPSSSEPQPNFGLRPTLQLDWKLDSSARRPV